MSTENTKKVRYTIWYVPEVKRTAHEMVQASLSTLGTDVETRVVNTTEVLAIVDIPQNLVEFFEKQLEEDERVDAYEEQITW